MIGMLGVLRVSVAPAPLSHPALRPSVASVPLDQGTGLLQIVDSERQLRVTADGAQVNRAHHVNTGIPEFLRESRECSRFVVESHDEHGPGRTNVPVFHEGLPSLDRLAYDQAHVGPAAGRLPAKRFDVDSRGSEDRGQFRQLAMAVGDLDVDLDHRSPLRRRWHYQATSVVNPRWSANWLSRSPLPAGPCPSDSPTCGSRSASGSVGS